GDLPIGPGRRRLLMVAIRPIGRDHSRGPEAQPRRRDTSGALESTKRRRRWRMAEARSRIASSARFERTYSASFAGSRLPLATGVTRRPTEGSRLSDVEAFAAVAVLLRFAQFARGWSECRCAGGTLGRLGDCRPCADGYHPAAMAEGMGIEHRDPDPAPEGFHELPDLLTEDASLDHAP